MRTFFIIAIATFLGAAPVNAQASGAFTADSTHDAVKAARAWWTAFAVGDTTYLRARTARRHSLTLSAGHVFDRVSMLARAATHIGGPKLGLSWSEESVHVVAKRAAVVHSRNQEIVGPSTRYFRYSTVLERVGGNWQVVAAHSTRENTLSSRIPASEAGALTDFAGRYRTRGGGFIHIVVRDSALSLTDPSGAEMLLEPVGPGLFEPSNLTLAGSMRFAFIRDVTGRVTALSRLSEGVLTFPRENIVR